MSRFVVRYLLLKILDNYHWLDCDIIYLTNDNYLKFLTINISQQTLTQINMVYINKYLVIKHESDKLKIISLNYKNTFYIEKH